MKRSLVMMEVVGAVMLAGSIAGCATQASTGNLCRQANGSYLDAIGRPGSDCSPLRGVAEFSEILGTIGGGSLYGASKVGRALFDI